MSKRYAWCSFVLLALLGASLIFYATDPFPWAFSDSVEYVVSARNLLRGQGLGLVQASGRFAPMSHFPPLYSLVLSGPGWTGMDPLEAARWLAPLLFSLFLFLLGATSILYLDSPGMGIPAVLLTLSSPLMLYLFSGVTSESLFLPLTFASVLSTVMYGVSQRRGFLLGGGAAAGLAILTRYSGLSLLLSGPLTTLVLSRGGRGRRAVDGILFAVVASLPIGVWMAGNLSSGGEAPRQLDLGLTGVGDRLASFRVHAIETLWTYVPFSFSFGVPSYRVMWVFLSAAAVAMVVTLTIISMRARRKGWDRPSSATVDLCVGLAIFVVAYLAGLAFASVAARPAPDIDARILSPVWVPVWFVVLALVDLAVKRRGVTPWSKLVPAALVIVVVAHSLPGARDVVADLHHRGAGYTSLDWRSSQTIEEVRRLPHEAPLISNESAAILLLVGRPAYDVPELINASPKDVFRGFGSDRSDPTETIFREEGAALVLFDSFQSQLESLYSNRAAERLASLTEGLLPYVTSPDGSIYFFTRPEWLEGTSDEETP